MGWSAQPLPCSARCQSPAPALLHRGKGCRTITFEQFKEALEELSKKRFKDKSGEDAVREVHRLVEGKAPIISGVTVRKRGSMGGPRGGGSWATPPLTHLSPTESRLLAHRVKAHGYLQVHRVPQGAL